MLSSTGYSFVLLLDQALVVFFSLLNLHIDGTADFKQKLMEGLNPSGNPELFIRMSLGISVAMLLLFLCIFIKGASLKTSERA